MADDAITRHFFSSFVRLHILHHAAEEPIYGAEIAEELVRHGYRNMLGRPPFTGDVPGTAID
jgi:hypothetical protein